ncbi:hypothetical protein pb186bvf_019860 [Paramecium bursaria]
MIVVQSFIDNKKSSTNYLIFNKLYTKMQIIDQLPTFCTVYNRVWKGLNMASDIDQRGEISYNNHPTKKY